MKKNSNHIYLLSRRIKWKLRKIDVYSFSDAILI